VLTVMNELKDRLREARKNAKKTQAQVAEAVGMKQPSYHQLESGKSSASVFLPKIARFLGVDVRWLEQGDGVTPQKSTDGDIRMANITFGAAIDPNPSNVKIPVYREVKAACGNGNEICLEDVSEYLDVDPRLLRLLGIATNPDNLKVIFSDEYSMWPTINPETPLFIDVQDNDPSRLKSGKIYVFTHAYHLRMKRVFVNFDGSVKFTSDNPDKNEYPDEIITAEQAHSVNFIGRLVWFGSPA
jgi:phage repressor protein C with HTH and peptisase S24 domain